MGFDVITCGSATLDVFAQTDNEQITVRHHKNHHNIKESFLAYPAGGKILIEKLQFELGGGGTNTAVGFARQGFKTAYLGCLGDDDTSVQVLSKLKSEKVTFVGKQVSVKSGYSIVLDSKAHDRTILAYKGANDLLQMSKVNDCPRAKIFYFSSMLGESLNSQIKLAVIASKKFNSLIAYNPSLYQVTKGVAKIKPLLRRVDILIFNKEEAQALTKKENIVDIHRNLQKQGLEIVIITDGAKLVTCSAFGLLYSFKPKKVQVVEATGAGDAFACGFVGTYAKTSDLAKSLIAGQANAQSVIRFVGAKKGLLSLSNFKKIKPKGIKRRPL